MTHNAQSSAEKRTCLLAVSRVAATDAIASFNGEDIQYVQFLDYFLIPLWDNLVNRFGQKLEALYKQVLTAIGSSLPGTGLSKALVTVCAPKNRTVQSSDDTDRTSAVASDRVAALGKGVQGRAYLPW